MYDNEDDYYDDHMEPYEDDLLEHENENVFQDQQWERDELYNEDGCEQDWCDEGDEEGYLEDCD